MNVYVIGCDELPERKAAALAHLKERGVDARYWRGVHGKSWGLRTTMEYEKGQSISPGHVGLNLGHWTLWNHLSHSLVHDYNWALVLEDDAVLPPDFTAKLLPLWDDLQSHVPDWDFVFVGLAEADGLRVWNKVTERIGPPDSRLCRLAWPWGTHAYLVRKRALPTLLDRMALAERNIDQQLYARVLEPNLLTWCAVLPSLVRQRTCDHDGTGRTEWAPSTIDHLPSGHPLKDAEDSFQKHEAQVRSYAEGRDAEITETDVDVMLRVARDKQVTSGRYRRTPKHLPTPDDAARCEVCDWPLVKSGNPKDGCVPGNCGYRPESEAEQSRLRERRVQLAAKETVTSLKATRAEAEDLPGRPSPATYAATLAYTDPYPCVYRGEFLEDAGDVTDGLYRGRTAPLSQCAKLNRPCHSKPDARVRAPRSAHDSAHVTDAIACQHCPHRHELAPTGVRPRLPLPEGHFNPSMIVYKNRLVLATRDSWGHSAVALWHLTNSVDDWTGEWSVAPIASLKSGHPDAPRLEDPRLFLAPAKCEKCDGRGGNEWDAMNTWDCGACNGAGRVDRLHAMFNLPDGYPPKKVRVGYVRFSEELDAIEETVVFPSPHGNLYEKNWVPFHARGELNWVYGIKPVHQIMSVDPEVDSQLRVVPAAEVSPVYNTYNPLAWTGGAARGGAAPVLHEGVYYHWFHGVLKRQQGSVYTVGCYTFESDPPYRVLRQTAIPLVWPDLPAHGEETVKRYVCWVGGAVFHAGAWHLALGIDDTFCRVVRVPAADVEAALTDAPEVQSVTSIRRTPVTQGVTGA